MIGSLIFFDAAQNVSDSQMQVLWAKILSGEVDSPGTFSKRTVNFVREFEKSEANLFTKLCGFGWTIDGFFRPLVFDVNAEIYNKHWIHFESLNHLESIGLIQLESIGYLINLRAGNITYYDKTLYLKGPTPDEDKKINSGVSIGKVMLTQTGKELSPICGSEPVDGFYEYVRHQWRDRLP